MATKFHFGKGKGNQFVSKPKRDVFGVILENEQVFEDNLDHDFGYPNEQDDQMLDDLSTLEQALLQATELQELDFEPQLQEAKEELNNSTNICVSFELFLQGSKLLQGNNNNVIIILLFYSLLNNLNLFYSGKR